MAKRVLSEEEYFKMEEQNKKQAEVNKPQPDPRVQQYRSQEERVAAEVARPRPQAEPEQEPAQQEPEKPKVFVVSFPVTEAMKNDIEQMVELTGFFGADALAQEAVRRMLYGTGRN